MDKKTVDIQETPDEKERKSAIEEEQAEHVPEDLKHELDVMYADLAQIRENTYQLIGSIGLTNCILYEIRDSLKKPDVFSEEYGETMKGMSILDLTEAIFNTEFHHLED